MLLRRTFASVTFATMALGALLLTPASGFSADAKTAAAAKTASAFSDRQRTELNAMIKDYITKNPEVLIASVEAHYNKQQEVKKAQEGRLDKVPADLVDANTPFMGPKDAKITLVEFFDYNCGYCKQVSADVQRLLGEDKTVRFAFKELPILSQSSELAARYALAANLQGKDKYFAFHNAVMDHQGSIDEDYLTATAKSQGLNVDKLKKDAESQDVKDMLSKNLELARSLGIRGTPYFIIGKEKVPGAIGYTNMKETIARERGEAPAPAAATPSSDTSAAETTKTDSVKTGDAAVTTDSATGSDAANQGDVDKAKAEAQAMIDELKAEAAKMQKEAQAQAEKAKADAAKADVKPATKTDSDKK